MAQQHQLRKAAGKYVDEYADYDEEFEYHQRLVSDEQFGVIAHCKRQLNLLQIGDKEINSDVEDNTDIAYDALDNALDARAEELK